MKQQMKSPKPSAYYKVKAQEMVVFIMINPNIYKGGSMAS